MLVTLKVAAIGGLIALHAGITLTAETPLPIVDLGYNIQQATTFNSTSDTYTFSNIRFAKAPVGELRFRAPQPPDVNRTAVQVGNFTQNCPSVYPAWLSTAQTYIPQYLAGQTNFTLPNTTASAPPVLSPLEDEDCLFLDVVVPQEVFAQADKGYGAPVLVWIYGGGYTGGSKTYYGGPDGLIKQSQKNGGAGIVYVALNYRLGAFGWLAGPTFQADGGTANAGLYDQRFALEWVRSNIAKFGGDPNRVTVFGESAGGGSIMHQITAFGGRDQDPPFQQAILQSPGWQPLVSNQQQEQIFEDFLQLANATTLDEARSLSSESLRVANSRQVLQSSYGGFTYGPALDGVFAPQLPGQLLARGQFSKNIRVVVGHNANEGILFTPPNYKLNDTVLQNQLKTLIPSVAAWPSVLEYISGTLYPRTDYPDEIARSSAMVAEAVFTCNTFYLDKAFGNRTYAYLFAIPPAEHGMDVPYTFYNGGAAVNNTIAVALQDYITHFAQFGYPSKQGVPFFPMYGTNASIQVLNTSGIRQTMDPAADQRCNWWQKALYY